MKKQDPEFFNFLKQNDQDLLKFGEDDEEDEDEEEEGGEDAKEDGEDNGEDDDEQEDPAEDGKKKRELTKEYITSLANSAEKVISLVLLVWFFTKTDHTLIGATGILSCSEESACGLPLRLPRARRAKRQGGEDQGEGQVQAQG